MMCATNKIFARSKKESQSNPIPQPKVNTNVVLIDFSILAKTNEILATGEPVFCKFCKGIFNFSSKLIGANAPSDEEVPKLISGDVLIKDEIEEEKKFEVEPQSIQKSQGNEWKCEFCSAVNQVKIEKEAIPLKDDVIYLIEKAKKPEKLANDQSETETKLSSSDGSTVILCLDNSGSMDAATDIKDSVTNRPLTRKQAVLVAVNMVTSELQKTSPNTKLGLVMFGANVNLIGDGSKELKLSSELNNYDFLKKTGEASYDQYMEKAIRDTNKSLLEKYKENKTEGYTALGPGLLVSVAMATNGKPGSKVIICTDGEANKGLGDLSSKTPESEDFYLKVGEYAKEKGICVSVITLKGQGCNVEILGRVADLTQGEVTRVDASQFGENFVQILKDEVIATNVELLSLLHKGLKFKNEPNFNLSQNGSQSLRNVGNVTKTTQVTFEYDFKDESELKISEVDLENVSQMPIQSQIYFFDKDGNKYVRVLTKLQKLTDKKEEVLQNADVGVLAANSIQKTAQLALEGKLKEAEQNAKDWQNLIVNDVGQMQNAGLAQNQIISYQEQNLDLIDSLSSQQQGVNLSKKDDAKTKMFKMKKAGYNNF